MIRRDALPNEGKGTCALYSIQRLSAGVYDWTRLPGGEGAVTVLISASPWDGAQPMAGPIHVANKRYLSFGLWWWLNLLLAW